MRSCGMALVFTDCATGYSPAFFEDSSHDRGVGVLFLLAYYLSFGRGGAGRTGVKLVKNSVPSKNGTPFNAMQSFNAIVLPSNNPPLPFTYCVSLTSHFQAHAPRGLSSWVGKWMFLRGKRTSSTVGT
jgi:hypothetical protein